MATVVIAVMLLQGAAEASRGVMPSGGVSIRPLTWTNITANLTVSPPAMSGQQMDYDPMTHSVLMFGGYSVTSGGGLADTWTFSIHGWKLLSPATNATSLNLGAMTYDSANRVHVLFGGNQNGISNTDPTYTFNGTWTTGTTTNPSGRANHAMAYDPVSNEVVMFGGCGPAYTNGACYPLGDTWTYTAGTWTNVSSNLSGAPSARWDAAMAYDPGLGGLVLFGGCTNTSLSLNTCNAASNDLWLFKSGAWSNITSSRKNQPGPSMGGGMVWDPNLHGMVMFGGVAPNGAANPTNVTNETWELSGTHWVRLHPTSGAPPSRYRVRMVYDPLLAEIVLFAGYDGSKPLGDTWVLH